MTRKFLTNIKQLNKPSARLMLHGTQFCCLLLIISAIVYLCNDFSDAYSYTVNGLCKTAVVTAVLVFAEVVIGGLFLDCYEKRHSGD